MSSGNVTGSQLEQLKQFTKVVADTGDFEAMKKFTPEDATTNPSLILKAAQMPAYASLLDKAIADGRNSSALGDRLVHQVFENVLILFGLEILKIVPGRVSTETDAAYSFDVDALVNQGQHFIRLYEQNGVPRERILIKIASTWEGVKAAEILQQSNINCNMTLLFSLAQAVACAQVGAKLVSPFVGRILDWHKQNSGMDFAPADDPGVRSVRAIYQYYKKFDHPTEVMGASFRNKGEIIELAGCDLLTISPELLNELASSHDPVPRQLDPESAKAADIEPLSVDEKAFRWMLNEDAMATEKTADGIRRFHADALKLHDLIRQKL